MHRDLKPSNILMDNHSGVHLIDFGLARRVLPPTESHEAHESTIEFPHTLSVEEYEITQTHSSFDTSVHTPSFPALQRHLTRHIATRWYRPPEVILLSVCSVVVCLE